MLSVLGFKDMRVMFKLDQDGKAVAFKAKLDPEAAPVVFVRSSSQKNPCFSSASALVDFSQVKKYHGMDMSKVTKIILIFIVFDIIVIGGYFGYKALSKGGSADIDYEWIQIDAYYTPLDDIEAFIKTDAEERDMLPVMIKNYGKDTKVLRKFRGKNFAGPTETQIRLKYRDLETWHLVELKYTADTGREAQRAILYVYEHQQWKVGDSGTIAQ